MLELSKNGFSREQSYKIVQKHAKKAWSEDISLLDILLSDKIIRSKVSIEKLKKIFDLKYHTKKVNLIFKRTFK